MNLDLGVLIPEPVDACCEAILTRANIPVTTKLGLSKAELKEEIAKYSGLIVRSATKVDAELISAGKNLKIIGRAGVGVDNIDLNASKAQGVLVINAPGGNTLSAAELTCVMITALSRDIYAASSALKDGKWDRKKFMAHELNGKTLAIIGLGRIGREVASRMQSFGMRTIGYDPLVSAEESAKFGVETLELTQIWPLADYVTVHVPLIKGITENMMNANVFAQCRKGIKVVNCARGGIINETDLLDALNSGQCGGAGLDVYTSEPPTCTDLVKHPKVVCTPHLGASTHEAQKRVAEEIADQMVSLHKGNSAHGIVDCPSFTLARTHPQWAKLCKSLGALVSMLFPKTDKDISIQANVYGKDIQGKKDLFAKAILIGMLKQRRGIDANFVSVGGLALDAGFEVKSVNLNPISTEDISVELHASSVLEKHTVLGTLNNSEPALCNVDNCQFKTVPFLSDDLIFLKGPNADDATSRVLGFLAEHGLIYNVAWGSRGRNNEESWCAIHPIGKIESFPSHVAEKLESVATSLHFFAQMKL